MKNRRSLLAILAFLLVSAVTFFLLRSFTATGNAYQYPTWQQAWCVEEDGSLTELVLEGSYLAGMEDGRLYRFQTALAELPEDSYLLLNYGGAACAVYLDSQEVFRAESAAQAGTVSDAQATIPLPLDAVQCTLTIDFRVLDAANCIYPPLVRVSSAWLEGADSFGFANLTGIPAGAYALLFILLMGLFLLGLCLGRRHWALLVPAAASALLAATSLASGQGYYFLPKGLTRARPWRGFDWLLPLLLLACLALQRRRGALRYFARVSLVTAIAMAVATAVSAVRDGYLAMYLHSLLQQLTMGLWHNLLYHITVYLTFAAAGITAYCVLAAALRQRAEASALAQRQKLTLENYRALQRQHEQTAGLRHEWTNQLTALRLLLQQGRLTELEQKLDDLSGSVALQPVRDYTENVAVNLLLQNAAARAQEAGVTLHAQVSVPGELALDETDLCTLLLNMLNNALEAASQVPEPGERSIWLQLSVAQGFLAIRCENSCTGRYERDESGELRSTKRDEGHGLGLPAMRAVAAKYHAALDLDCGENRFAMQTALKL